MEPTLFPLSQVAVVKRQPLRYKKDPNKKLGNRRYYLHRIIRAKYQVNSEERSIDVPYKEFREIPVPDRYYIGQLIEMGYNVQLKLYDE